MIATNNPYSAYSPNISIRSLIANIIMDVREDVKSFFTFYLSICAPDVSIICSLINYF